jgi:hypothetical protein
VTLLKFPTPGASGDVWIDPSQVLAVLPGPVLGSAVIVLPYQMQVPVRMSATDVAEAVTKATEVRVFGGLRA